MSFRSGRRSQAYASILMARLLAYVAVVALGLLAFAAALLGGGTPHPDLAFATALFAIPAVGVALLLAGDGLQRQIERWTPALGTRLGRFLSALRDVLRAPGRLVGIFTWSLVAQISGNLLVVTALALAFGLDVPASFHWAAIPLITLVTLLPLSINGIGIREGAFVYCYARVGLDPAEALSLSLAFTAVLAAWSGIGGLLLLGPSAAGATKRTHP